MSAHPHPLLLQDTQSVLRLLHRCGQLHLRYTKPFHVCTRHSCRLKSQHTPSTLTGLCLVRTEIGAPLMPVAQQPPPVSSPTASQAQQQAVARTKALVGGWLSPATAVVVVAAAGMVLLMEAAARISRSSLLTARRLTLAGVRMRLGKSECLQHGRCLPGIKRQLRAAMHAAALLQTEHGCSFCDSTPVTHQQSLIGCVTYSQQHRMCEPCRQPPASAWLQHAMSLCCDGCGLESGAVTFACLLLQVPEA